MELQMHNVISFNEVSNYLYVVEIHLIATNEWAEGQLGSFVMQANVIRFEFIFAI